MSIKTTVIGAGFMGNTHSQALSEHPEFELQSIVDLDENRAKIVADRYNVKRVLTDYESALEKSDAAIIATPRSIHAEQAFSALKRDVHILVEKPITNDITNARRLAKRARNSDTVSGTGFLLRYETAYAKACQTAIEGDLGEVVGARVKRTNTVAEIERLGDRGHPIPYASIHDIDILNHALKGKVTNVFAVDRQGSHVYDIPDAVQAVLTYESGTIATLEAYTVLPEDTPKTPNTSLELTGTEGYASVTTPGDVLTVHTKRYDYPDTRHWPVINGRMDGAIRRQITRFADAIAGRNEIEATIFDGYKAQIVSDAIQRAIGEDEPISVEWEENLR